MLIVVKLQAGNQPTYIYSPKMYSGGNMQLAKGLVYYQGDDLPDLWDGGRMMRTGAGVLTGINGHNVSSKTMGIEIRPHEMAEFCRKFLAEYDESEHRTTPNYPLD